MLDYLYALILEQKKTKDIYTYKLAKARENLRV